LPIPRAALGLAQAAALPENLFTAWTNLIDRGPAPVRRVDTHPWRPPAASATRPIQLAKLHGATVFTTVGNDQKAEVLSRHFGADVVINYRTQNFVAEVQAHTAMRGVDLILDMVGGKNIAQKRHSAHAGRPAGADSRFLEGSKVTEFDFMPIMLRRLTLTGSTLRPSQRRGKKPPSRRADLRRATSWPRLESGEMKSRHPPCIPRWRTLPRPTG